MALGIKVPVQVDALVVGKTPVNNWTGPTTGNAPFAAGTELPKGIHLHWALPDALVTGPAVARKNGAEIGAGRLLELADAKGTPTTSFAIYEIPFFVRRAVELRTWAGAAAEEGGAFTSSTIASTTVVGLEGETPTETGCGA